MSHRLLPTLMLAICLASCSSQPAPPAPAAAPPKDEWRSLFDGRDLSGWQKTGSADWHVDHKDGWPDMIVGGQDGDPKRGGNLCTVEQFQNFELELEFMIDEHGKYNSGVYLRNPPADAKSGKNGYQVNIGRAAAGEYTGGIVVTDAPGTKPGTPTWLAKGDETDAYRRPMEWNRMRILAVGGHVVVHLNDHEVANLTDTAPDRDPRYFGKGVIALQTYGAEGHAGWVKFRNLRIRVLPDTPAPAAQ
jgi:hypothetical protein